MFVSIYKLQMLVGSVTAWQLGLCLVYFSTTLSLDDTKGPASFFFLLLILDQAVLLSLQNMLFTACLFRDHVQMTHECRPLFF